MSCREWCNRKIVGGPVPRETRAVAVGALTTAATCSTSRSNGDEWSGARRYRRMANRTSRLRCGSTSAILGLSPSGRFSEKARHPRTRTRLDCASEGNSCGIVSRVCNVRALSGQYGVRLFAVRGRAEDTGDRRISHGGRLREKPPHERWCSGRRVRRDAPRPGVVREAPIQCKRRRG